MKRQDVSGQNTLHTDATVSGGSAVDLIGINGTAPSTGLGASDAGTLRVAISSDSPSSGNPAAGATGAVVPAQASYDGLNVGGTLRGATAVNPAGSVFAQQIDLASVAGTTTATGNGVVSAGVQRVAIASDNTAFGVNATLQAGAALVGKVGIDQTTPGTTNAISLAQIGATTTATGNGVVGTGVQRVAIASDNTAFAVNATLQAGAAVIGHVITDSGSVVAGTGTAGAAAAGVLTVQGIAGMTKLLVTPDANAAVNVAQLAGTATSVNSGVKDAGTLRVVLATDQPQLTNKLLVTPDANSAINLAQVNGQTVNVGTGAAGTGTARVTTSTDSTIGTLTTITNAVTVAQATAANLNATVVGTGTFATQSTLSAGTALIGKVSASNETSTIYSGTTALTPKFAAISASSNGNNTVIAAGTNKIRVLAWNLMANGTVNVKWQSGAGGTDLTGLYYLIANTGISVPYSPVGYFETASATLLNLNLSGAVAVGGNIVYIDVA